MRVHTHARTHACFPLVAVVCHIFVVGARTYVYVYLYVAVAVAAAPFTKTISYTKLTNPLRRGRTPYLTDVVDGVKTAVGIVTKPVCVCVWRSEFCAYILTLCVCRAVAGCAKNDERTHGNLLLYLRVARVKPR